MSKDLVTDRLQINVTVMCQLGMIPKNGYQAGRLFWSNETGEEIGHIDYRTTVWFGSASVRFIYRLTASDGQCRDINQIVGLTGVDCHLGGFRWYFRCPSCSRRSAILYSSYSGFFCRVCSGLAYPSQNEPKSSRYGFIRALVLEEKQEQLFASIKRTHYAGKPTKKLQALMALQGKTKIEVINEIKREYNQIEDERF